MLGGAGGGRSCLRRFSCYYNQMARPVRVEFAGGLYYVSSPNDGRRPVVRGDGDRYVWLEVLEATLERYGWRCHGWCLMDGGYHLVVETPQANLSLGMRQLNGVYTQRFNAKHGTKGQLFHGRFRSLVAERGAALLAVVGFMAACPVVAGLVKRPQEYEWSSYAELTGRRPGKRWLEQSLVLGLVGRSRKWARDELITTVEGREAEFVAPHTAAVGQCYLGTPEFVERMRSLAAGSLKGGKPGVARQAGQGKQAGPAGHGGNPGNNTTLEELFSPLPTDKAERNRRIARAHGAGFTLAEIGRAVGLHYGHVSKIVKREEKVQGSDTPLLLLMD